MKRISCLALCCLVIAIELSAYVLICLAAFEASKGLGFLATGFVLLWVTMRIDEVVNKVEKEEKE